MKVNLYSRYIAYIGRAKISKKQKQKLIRYIVADNLKQ